MAAAQQMYIEIEESLKIPFIVIFFASFRVFRGHIYLFFSSGTNTFRLLNHD